MSIPFIRMNPGGKRRVEQIPRSAVVENLACAFLERGGRYLIEMVPDQANEGTVRVHLVAIIDLADGAEKVADIVCPNGPGLPENVDALIRQSIANTPPPVLVPANSNHLGLVS